MPIQIEKEINIKARRSYELLLESTESFEKFLDPSLPGSNPLYYQARNMLKEGKGYFDQALQHAKKLLGPIPIYAAKDFEKWREQVLLENRIIIIGKAMEEVRSELAADELVKLMMSPEEINAYLVARYESQSTGKRKLPNIKIRMIIDRLGELLGRARELQKKAQQKQQGLPY